MEERNDEIEKFRSVEINLDCKDTNAPVLVDAAVVVTTRPEVDNIQNPYFF